jgi:hypothetical protein
LDPADRPEGRENAGETADSLFHPSRPSGLGYLIWLKALMLQTKSVQGLARRQSIWGIRVQDNAVRLQLFALAYNLANFLRSLALPSDVAHWSLSTLREKLVKIGARIVRHGRYLVFQLAEVAVPRSLFAEILRRIGRLRGSPVPAT